MSVVPAAVTRLASALSAIVAPLLGATPPAKKHVDQAVDHASGRPATNGKGPAPVAADELPIHVAIPVALVRRIEARPPMTWENGPCCGWRCGDAPTEVKVRFTDGSETTDMLPAGALLRVACDLIHVPEAVVPQS
jgi:hypothetical protein